mmetsp:Transcript_19745/g.22596  ORF Transcript_19745/g.22596 Transcript_19745/m.22596 type:complete len:135 (+) Transcript_19745:186-590(+)
MPRRLYANENPQKQNAPGHGSVERAKGAMWTTPASTTTSATTSSSTSTIAAPHYNTQKYVVAKVGSGGDIMSTLGIGRGGGRAGRGGVAKKKVEKTIKTTAVATAATTTSVGREQGGRGERERVRANPDVGFFN